MKRAKREESSKSMDRISELPKDISRRILYFLTQDEAARTSALSKSWRYIWCTRPNLDFSYKTFKENKQDFLSTVHKTLQRYRDQRLHVEEFELCISLGDYSNRESVPLLERWIATLRIMATKKFSLSIRLKEGQRRVKFPSVVFGAESLQDLHVKRFKLDKKTIRRIVLLKHLKTLRLQLVSIEDEIFHKVISCCPLIETLYVEECERLTTIDMSDNHNLKNFTFSMNDYDEEPCRIEIHPPSIQTIDNKEGNIWFHKGACFRNLNRLSLWDMTSSLEHLSSCKFPSLEYLTLRDCDVLKEVQLFFDAPNIKGFHYEGDFVPSISVATTSNKWMSRIDVTYPPRNGSPSSWFLKLHGLLKSLSQSEIILTVINQHPIRDDDEDVVQENVNPIQDNGCYEPVVVKRLRFRCHLLSIPSILNAFLCICRPRRISTPYRCYDNKRWEMEFTECLCKILMRRESGELWEGDLEEVILEIHVSNRKGWHPITLSELPNYQHMEHISARIPLKWRQTSLS